MTIMKRLDRHSFVCEILCMKKRQRNFVSFSLSIQFHFFFLFLSLKKKTYHDVNHIKPHSTKYINNDVCVSYADLETLFFVCFISFFLVIQLCNEIHFDHISQSLAQFLCFLFDSSLRV
jgi:hypothetical protein